VSGDAPKIRSAHGDSGPLAAWLEDRLYEFNVEATGFTDGEGLCFTIEDGDRIVAGIAGHTWGGCCEIKQLWVDAASRRRGLGRALLVSAEQEARRRGCDQMVLSTHSFQAPGLYRSLAFEEVARIDDHPRGYSNIVFVKRLDRVP